MTNHSNTCYVNSVLHALAALVDEGRSFQELSFLLEQCSNHDSDLKPLNPISLFALRSLLPRWRFDGRQQDAAEFYIALTVDRGGDLQPVPWHGRTDGQAEEVDTGESPLFLPMDPGSTTLQQILVALHDNTFQRGLLRAPPLLAVVVGRWWGGAKVRTAMALH